MPPLSAPPTCYTSRRFPIRTTRLDAGWAMSCGRRQCAGREHSRRGRQRLINTGKTMLLTITHVIDCNMCACSADTAQYLPAITGPVIGRQADWQLRNTAAGAHFRAVSIVSSCTVIALSDAARATHSADTAISASATISRIAISRRISAQRRCARCARSHTQCGPRVRDATLFSQYPCRAGCAAQQRPHHAMLSSGLLQNPALRVEKNP